MNKHQPKFEDGETVVIQSQGELTSIWRVFYNDCGQPMYEIDDERHVYEWQIRKPTREELYGEDKEQTEIPQQWVHVAVEERKNWFSIGNRIWFNAQWDAPLTGEIIATCEYANSVQRLDIQLDKPIQRKWGMQETYALSTDGGPYRWDISIKRLS